MYNMLSPGQFSFVNDWSCYRSTVGSTTAKPTIMEIKMGILMADLSGYTALTEVHGDYTAMATIERYLQIAQNAMVGETVLLERAGDQLIMINEDADELAETAINLVRNSKKESNFLSIHAGLHHGSLIRSNEQYFGGAINLAARIASEAKNNMILSSQDFIDAMSAPSLYRVRSQGQIHFKNVMEPKEIYELLPLSASKHQPVICPVCRMQLDETQLDISYSNGNDVYFFCSLECKEIFQRQYAGKLESMGVITG